MLFENDATPLPFVVAVRVTLYGPPVTVTVAPVTFAPSHWTSALMLPIGGSLRLMFAVVVAPVAITAEPVAVTLPGASVTEIV